MEDISILRKLSAKRNINSLLLTFTHRLIEKESFISVDKALYFLEKLVNHEAINADSAIFGLDMSPILYINIVDTSIMSIVEEVIAQKFNNDKSFINYIYNEVSSFVNRYRSVAKNNSSKEPYWAYIMYVMDDIVHLLSPYGIYKDEWTDALSVDYYQMMFSMYSFYNEKFPDEKYYYKMKEIYMNMKSQKPKVYGN